MVQSFNVAATRPSETRLSPDGSRLYSAGEDGIVRVYSLKTGALIDSWQVGVKLGGMDISPDGSFLMVTERQPVSGGFSPSNKVVTVYKVDTATGNSTSFPTQASAYDSAFFDAAVLSDGKVLLSQSFDGSGWVTLKLLDTATGQYTSGPSVRQNSTLTRSATGDKVLIAEANISNAQLDIYQTGTGIVATTGAGGFNFGIQAYSASGNLATHYIYNEGIRIYNGLLQYVVTLTAAPGGSWLNGRVTDLLFDPAGQNLFVLDNEANTIVQIRTSDWSVVRSIPVGADVGGWSGGFNAFGSRLIMDPLGRYFSVVTDSALVLVANPAAPAMTGTAGSDDLDGTLFADVINGNDGADSIEGAGDNDRLDGGGGGDSLDGGDGNDVLIGGAGADTLSGGNGVDQLFSHTGSPSSASYSGTFSLFYTGTLSEDVLAEADSLSGGDGDDFLFAGYGDGVDGGSGTDRLYISFQGSAAGVTADFRPLKTQASVTIGGATISGIEHVDFLEGSEFDDLLAPISSGYPATNYIYGRGGNDHIIADNYSGWNDGAIYGGSGDDLIDGRESNSGLEIYGEGGDDHILAGFGFGTAYGGEGNDRLDGTYVSNSLYGGEDDDVIDGAQMSDSLYGEGGNDTIYGGGDYDLIEGGEGNDVLYGDSSPLGAGNGLFPSNNGDTLNGGAGTDTIHGEQGNDLIDGGTGADTMRGGAGDDLYTVDDAGDVVEENGGEGTDEIRTSLASFSLAALPNVEKLTGTSATGQILTGNSADNVVTAGGGNDVLRLNSGGNDTVNAGAGNDNIFFIAALTAGDVVDGGAGVDTLVLQGPYGSLTLSANVTQIENVSILGGNNTNFGEPGTNRYDYVLTTHDSNFAAGVQARINGAALLEGEDFTFDGSAETDAKFVVYGGKGKDTLLGGLGNDIFFYAEDRFASGDTVNGGAGYDGMFLRGNYTIDFNAPGYTGLFTNIENLTLTSATDERYARGGGSEFDYNLTLSDAIVNAGQELTVSGALLMAGETMILDASQETDGRVRLFGGKSADTLKGGGQIDLLHGNLGSDNLSGGGGADSFRYQDTAESNAAAMDHIIDFTPGTDKIELDRIDANTGVAGDQAFTWIGSNAFSGVAGQLRAFQSGSDWIVEGDVNGDSVADLVIALTLQGPTPLGAGDFIL